jgi:hypothetical protein
VEVRRQRLEELSAGGDGAAVVVLKIERIAKYLNLLLVSRVLRLGDPAEKCKRVVLGLNKRGRVCI